MKYLLDTHLLLRALSEPGRLSQAAVQILGSSECETVFSSVSLWEVAVKQTRRGSGFGFEPEVLLRRLLETGCTALEMTNRHVLALRGLPLLHGDPFDRMLVAQAIAEGITLLTTDAMVARYPGPIRRV